MRVQPMGGPYGLDMGAVMLMGSASGVDTALLSEVLPAVENAVLSSFDEDGE